MLYPDRCHWVTGCSRSKSSSPD